MIYQYFYQYIFFSFFLFTFLYNLLFNPHPNISIGGGKEDRTPDPLLAKQVLSQLSYTPSLNLGYGLSTIIANGGSGKT